MTQINYQNYRATILRVVQAARKARHFDDARRLIRKIREMDRFVGQPVTGEELFSVTIH